MNLLNRALIITTLIWFCGCTSTKSMAEHRTDIQMKISESKPQLKECYDLSLKQDHELEGVIIMQFAVHPSGEVSEVTVVEERSTLNKKDLSDCLISKVKEIRFPNILPDQRPREITFPFRFSKQIYERSTLQKSQNGIRIRLHHHTYNADDSVASLMPHRKILE